MSGGSRSTELKLFEALENYTHDDSFSSKASFVQNFLHRDLDLNNTQQSIVIEDMSGEEEDSSSSEDASYISVGSENISMQDGHETSKVKLLGKGRDALLSLLLRRHAIANQNKVEKGDSDKVSQVGVERESQEEDEDGASQLDNDEENQEEENEVSEFEEDDQDSEEDQDEVSHIDEDDKVNQEEDEDISRLGDNLENEDDDDESNQSQDDDEKENQNRTGAPIDEVENLSQYFKLLELKRSLDEQQSQLSKEKEAFSKFKCADENRMKAERKRIESQKKSLQNVMADYQKIKFSREEYEEKMKQLSDQLKETKLQMNKRMSRWSDQQRRLEERVKALEKENEELKKSQPSSVSSRLAKLKRPPMRIINNKKPLKPQTQPPQPRRVQFADECNYTGEEEEKATERSKLKIHGESSSFTDNSTVSPTSSTHSDRNRSINDSPGENHVECQKEIHLSDDEADKTMPSDYVEIRHPCGTVTRITKDNKLTRHVLLNKDVMDEFEDCSVRYYYHELGFSQTTYPNGDEIIEYDSGEIETKRADGSKIFTYGDGLVKMVDGATGSEEVIFGDGSVVKTAANGDCTITWPSGQKEVRTANFVKRIYTNGTVKIMYKDGSEETRYFNGRVRRKDKNGVLVDDTKKLNSKK